MATLTKTFTWDSDNEGFTLTESAGAGTFSRDTGNGSPTNGSLLQDGETGRNKTGEGQALIDDGTWESVFGIPAGSTINSIQIEDVRTYAGLTAWVAGESVDWSVHIYETTGATSVTGTDPIWSRNATAADSGWVQAGQQTAQNVTSTYQASNTTIDVLIHIATANLNDGAAHVTGHLDYLSITIDYTAPLTTYSGSFTGDAIFLATVAGSLSADAIVLATVEGSLTADAVRQDTFEGSLAADAVILAPQSGAITADAVVLASISGALSADAIVLATVEVTTLTADAWLVFPPITGDFTVDAVITATVSGALAADAILLASQAGSFTADSIVGAVGTGAFTADATILAVSVGGLVADAIVLATQPDSFSASAWLAGTFTVDAVISTGAQGFPIDAVISIVGPCVWVSPANLGGMSATPTLVFLMPAATGNMHFQIELDTDSGFSDPTVVQSPGTGWEYWDGGGWQAIPDSGVPNTYSGNEARYTVQSPLSQATWYRRVRAGVIT